MLTMSVYRDLLGHRLGQIQKVPLQLVLLLHLALRAWVLGVGLLALGPLRALALVLVSIYFQSTYFILL
tara:strand:+ start:49 stop:255 length:207 start_codon:yes stop_codon:yes gene_type:complete